MEEQGIGFGSMLALIILKLVLVVCYFLCATVGVLLAVKIFGIDTSKYSAAIGKLLPKREKKEKPVVEEPVIPPTAKTEKKK